MKKMKKLIALLLTVVMSLSLAACGSSSSGGSKGGSEDPITLTVYSQLANYSGEITGWFAQVLLDKFNVKMNIVPDTDGVYDTRMEAGDLGDIVIWGSDGDDYLQAVEQGLLYNWEEDDLLTEYGPYIKENMPYALEKNRNLNGGTIYGFGHNVATSSEDHEAFFYTWDIRWDLYKQLGYPTVKNLDDFITVMEQMKEINPTDEAGNSTYAVSLWPDWDGNMVMYVKSMATAYYGFDELGVGLYDNATGTFHDALEENGPYLTSLKFFNKLYQKGLLDPDSMTQTYDQMAEKVKKGGTFFSIFNFAGSAAFNTDENVGNNKMMLSLIPEEATPIAYGMNVKGGNRIWSIGAKTQYPEVCMEIINWLATPEGTLTFFYGPKDLCWYYDEEGNTMFTELGRKINADRKYVVTEEEGGLYAGNFNDGSAQFNNTTWSVDATNPESNGETYNSKMWKSNQLEPKNDTEADWRTFTGTTMIEEYMNSKPYKLAPATAYTESSKSDELKVVWSQVTEAIKNYSWQAIYAATDEEYDAIVAEMIAKANEYDYAQCVEWSANEAAIKHALELEVTK